MKHINKKIFGMIIGVVAICCVVIVGGVYLFDKGNEKEKQKKSVPPDERIILNRLGTDTVQTKISGITFQDGVENAFSQKMSIYKMKPRKYERNDIENIAKCLGKKIVKKSNANDIFTEYIMQDDAYLEYYSQSGSLSYVSVKEKPEVEGMKFDKEKCISITEEFIKKSQIANYDELELSYAKVAESLETGNGRQELSFVICYLKKAPEGVEYCGIGPGVKVEINAKYEVCGFTSVDKKIEKAVGEYTTLGVECVTNKVGAGKDVQIISNTEGEIKNVTIEKVKIGFYSDPAQSEQKYMAPYYVLEGKDVNQNNVMIVVPAVEHENITYK